MSLFEFGQSGISFFGGHVLPSKLEFLPRIESVLAENFALFFTLNKLGNRLTHKPMRRALACISQTLHASLDILINLDRHRTNSSGHIDLNRY